MVRVPTQQRRLDARDNVRWDNLLYHCEFYKLKTVFSICFTVSWMFCLRWKERKTLNSEPKFVLSKIFPFVSSFGSGNKFVTLGLMTWIVELTSRWDVTVFVPLVHNYRRKHLAACPGQSSSFYFCFVLFCFPETTSY